MKSKLHGSSTWGPGSPEFPRVFSNDFTMAHVLSALDLPCFGTSCQQRREGHRLRCCMANFKHLMKCQNTTGDWCPRILTPIIHSIRSNQQSQTPLPPTIMSKYHRKPIKIIEHLALFRCFSPVYFLSKARLRGDRNESWTARPAKLPGELMDIGMAIDGNKCYPRINVRKDEENPRWNSRKIVYK